MQPVREFSVLRMSSSGSVLSTSSEEPSTYIIAVTYPNMEVEASEDSYEVVSHNYNNFPVIGRQGVVPLGEE
ncbi:hypothetical protein M758_UG301800 [Ceratodon purpureus]|nr:hypothetical protein M758_UG301800 [Ceratodon purpureus]